MGEFFSSLRFEHPKLWRCIVLLFLAAFCVAVFASLPATPLLRALGVTDAQGRVGALYYAAYWQMRAHANRESVPIVRTEYGSIVGLDRQGNLVASLPVDDHFVNTKLRIADVTLKDLFGAVVMVSQLRTEDVKFEIYEPDLAVIWVRGVPLNVKLVEAGHAIPDPNPPTNIVDKAFAAYYWRAFKGD